MKNNTNTHLTCGKWVLGMSLPNFLNNSVFFEFISSSMTIFSLSTKALLSNWKIDSYNINNHYFSWQWYFVKNSFYRMTNAILKHVEFNSLHLIFVPNLYSPCKDFLNLSRLSFVHSMIHKYIQCWVVGLCVVSLTWHTI